LVVHDLRLEDLEQPALAPELIVFRAEIGIGPAVDLDLAVGAGAPNGIVKYGAVDDDIVRRLIKNCKERSPDCTEEEIVYFVAEKGSLVRVKDSRIYSPIGFLLTAVPKCLSGEAFRFYREEQLRRREAESASEAQRQAELENWRRDQEAQLADPTVPEEDKNFIREYLGLH